jgi:hypothetical protein
MRLVFICLLSILICGCSWLGTLSSIIPSDNKTTGHGNNNKVLVGDNSTNVGTKSIDADDVNGDLSGRDKYHAGTITMHQTNAWALIVSAMAGAFMIILSIFAFTMMNRRRRRQMFSCMKKGVRLGRLSGQQTNN